MKVSTDQPALEAAKMGLRLTSNGCVVGKKMNRYVEESLMTRAGYIGWTQYPRAHDGPITKTKQQGHDCIPLS